MNARKIAPVRNLSNELRVRAEGEALLEQAADAAVAARDHSRADRADAASLVV